MGAVEKHFYQTCTQSSPRLTAALHLREDKWTEASRRGYGIAIMVSPVIPPLLPVPHCQFAALWGYGQQEKASKATVNLGLRQHTATQSEL